jgi:quercetin dioxygenase-like cupin family protein
MRSLLGSAFVLTLVLTAVLVSPAEAQLLTKPLPNLPANQEMRVIEISLAPGQSSSPHRHNAHVFVYVLEGRVNMQVTGGPVMTLGPGETFYESPSDVHSVSANASATEPAKFLVHMLRTEGTPVSTPVPN